MQSKFIERMVREGTWRSEVVPAEVVGLSRDLTVYRAVRRTNLVTHRDHGDPDTFCPSMWWDLGIGSGACGQGCRSCFLMLTFRTMRDPMRHVLYSNVEDFWNAARQWLVHPKRQGQHSLGLGIDRSDSLLYEGITGHARHLIPLFADPRQNPKGNLLFLLTKTANVHYLEGLPTANVAVTFSLNPEVIADLWEGKWPDTRERITRPIHDRLAASLQAQRWGFETRWRLDPILTPPNWPRMYKEFLAQTAGMGARPHRITLGTYREKDPRLDLWREKWGLLPMEWEAGDTVKEGTHYRVPNNARCTYYRKVVDLCRQHFPDSKVSLCKETFRTREALGLCGSECNCLNGSFPGL